MHTFLDIFQLIHEFDISEIEDFTRAASVLRVSNTFELANVETISKGAFVRINRQKLTLFSADALALRWTSSLLTFPSRLSLNSNCIKSKNKSPPQKFIGFSH